MEGDSKFSSMGMALYTAGNMIGTGTHQTLIALAKDGCGNLLWVNFLLSGMLVTLSALPLFHLYAKFPSNDCLHRSAEAGLGKRWGNLISFINGQLITIELLFAVTMQVSFFGSCAATLLPESLGISAKLVALTLLMVLWLAFRARGALFTANIAFWLGVLELGTVGLLVLSSFLGWSRGSTLRPFMSLLDMAETKWSQFPSGIHVAVFAYGGFPGMIQAGDLVGNPSRDLPLGIVMACVLTMCIYTSMSASVLLVTAPESIAKFATGFDCLHGILPETLLKGISLTVLSSVANNVMENSLVVISNLDQMVSKGKSLTFMNLGLCSSDSVTFGLIMALTLFKDAIGLGFLGDAIDFALLLQFAIFALLSIANQAEKSPSLALPLVSLTANVLLATWHLSHASPMPFLVLLFLVFLPLALQQAKSKSE